MDSMRHLSTSLPSMRRRQDHSELLADFRAAALSVTNLYKSAAASQDKARNAGYQDALDDLLAFLDKEHLGLMDGEGWTVRQWATERLIDEGGARQPAADDEEEENQTERGEDADGVDTARSSSPEAQRKPPTLTATSSEMDDAPSRRKSSAEPPQPPMTVPSLDTFTFRSDNPCQTHGNEQAAIAHGMDLDSSPASAASPSLSATESPRVLPRSSRARHTNHNRRGSPSVLNFSLATGAGNKRKIPYPDFFDISGLPPDPQDRKDGGGRGGKRGRFV